MLPPIHAHSHPPYMNAAILVLGLDFGTSGARACVLDLHGEVRAQAAVPLPASTSCVDGGREQSPADWWQALHPLLRALQADIALSRLRAVAIDGTSGTLVACDAQGQPLAPALMYDDRRASALAQRLATINPAASGAFGAGSGGGSSLAKLLWLLEHGLRPARVQHQAEWIAGRLLGRHDFGDENNALKLGYDILQRRWPQGLTTLGVDPACLPRVVAAGTPLGVIAPARATELGLPENLRIVAGTTDGVASVLATGAFEPGDAVTALGSTLTLKVIGASPVFAAESGAYSHRLRLAGEDRWLAGGASNSGGAVLRQFFSNAQLQMLSARIDPQTDSGLDYYPLPGVGERFPYNDPTLAPRLLPRPADDVHFLHGLLEGIARIERDGYRRLAALGTPYPQRVLSVGGGATNTVWTALRARLLAVPVLRASATEAAHGAARLALAACPQ